MSDITRQACSHDVGETSTDQRNPVVFAMCLALLAGFPMWLSVIRMQEIEALMQPSWKALWYTKKLNMLLHPGGASLMTHPDPLTDELRSTLEAHYDLRFFAAAPLLGGEEALIWQVSSSLGPLVVRMSPAHRSPVRLQQIHQVLLTIAPVLPPILAPLMAPDGSTLLSYHGRVVELFPFVSGEQLDREDARLRQAAAQLLAQVHMTLLSQTQHAASLARKGVVGEQLAHTSTDPPGLHDPDLDRWHRTLRAYPAAFTTGLIHGDYYRGNLLTQEGQIVALLDWDDLHPDFLIQEVAWASWEFGKTASSDDWQLDRVQAFLQDYREAGGPCKAEEYHAIIPFVRWRLRDELRYHHFAQIAAGLPGNPDYAAGQVRAFERLRACKAIFI
jgi:Ser/Thr protein kinase RdoA (MazF antagonist)